MFIKRLKIVAFDKEKLIYILVAIPAKIIKSSFEVLSFFFLSTSDYAKLIPVFNQSQIASTWILAGFGSAGYKYFINDSFRLRLIISITVLVGNSILIALIIAIFELYKPYDIPLTSIIGGLVWASATAIAVFLRSSDKLILSVIVLEVIPFCGLILAFLLNGRLYFFDVTDVFIYALGITLLVSLLVLIFINRELLQVNYFSSRKLHHYKEYFQISAPFALVSCSNIVLSRIDTSIVSELVDEKAFSSYTISVRFAALILTIGYIFQHYYSPKITRMLLEQKPALAHQQIILYMRDTFIISCIALAGMYFSIFIGLLDWFGIRIDIPIFLSASSLLIFISPLTVLTYVLILCGDIKLVTVSAIAGLLISILLISYLGSDLEVSMLPYILFGSMLLSKLIELVCFFKKGKAKLLPV